MRVCSFCCGHLDCTCCASQVSQGSTRNVCIIPGDPLYSYYWCTFSVDSTAKHCQHNSWRPLDLIFLSCTDSSDIPDTNDVCSEQGGWWEGSGFKLSVTLLCLSGTSTVEFGVELKLPSSHEFQVKTQAQRGGCLNPDQIFLPKNLAYLR